MQLDRLSKKLEGIEKASDKRYLEHAKTGEPCALKGASTVRRGGKGTPCHAETPALLYLTTIRGCSKNLTCIALGFVRSAL